MTARLRAFVALPLSGEIAARVAEVSSDLAARPAVARLAPRWVRPGHHHLTLRFLGDVSPAGVPGIAAAMRDTAATTPPPRLTARGLVGLGGRRPRVLALEVSAEPPLEPLVDALSLRLDALGFPREARPFRAHVTLARCGRPGSVEGLFAGIPLPPDRLDVPEVVLFRSDLSPRGPTYTPLATAPFAPR